VLVAAYTNPFFDVTVVLVWRALCISWLYYKKISRRQFYRGICIKR